MSRRQVQVSLSDLLLFPVTVPMKGFLFVLDQLQEMVDTELFDEQRLYRNLMELEMSFELGDISEADYQAQHSRLLARLQELKARRSPDGAGDEGR